jgi:hypothetical protein
MKLVLVVIGLLFSACAANIQAVQRVTEIPGQIRISVREVDDGLFSFEIVNESTAPMMIDREEVKLLTPRGERRRLPGGLGSTYTLAPGGVHKVNVRFDIGGIREGDQVMVSFADAIQLLPNYRLPIEPLLFCAR